MYDGTGARSKAGINTKGRFHLAQDQQLLYAPVPRRAQVGKTGLARATKQTKAHGLGTDWPLKAP